MAQKPQTTREKLHTVIFTTFSHDLINQNLKNQFDLVIPSVMIKQYPEEIVSVKLTISEACIKCRALTSTYEYMYNPCSCSDRKYSILVGFKNDLHFISQDYCYEISCKISAKNVQGEEENIAFRTNAEKRNSESICFTGKIIDKPNYLSNLKASSISFNIHRFLDNKDTHLSDVVVKNELFSNEDFGDVKIKVGPKIFYVHKHILSQKSEVFKAMFCHDMAENKNGLVNIKEMDKKTDPEPEVIEEMLTFIYTDKVENLSKMPFKLYKAAHVYQIKDLMNKCLEYIMFNVNSESFVSALQLAITYDQEKLEVGIDKYIKCHEAEFVKRKDYQNFLVAKLSMGTFVHTLELCAEYPKILGKIKLKVLQFLKANNKSVVKDKGFLDLFRTHHELMKEVFVFLNK